MARAFVLELAPRARQDFVDILRYTAETWGTRQLEVYRDKLDAALQVIGRDPGRGHRRDDLPPTHLVFPVGSHVIVYRVSGDRIGVVRILHQRMALGRHV
jgi:toxin ParE1/3/4